MNLLDTIIEKIKSNYDGILNCEEQRADLFVYVNGNEETIKSISTERIFFENEECDVDLIDADIHTLAYINEVIYQNGK